VNKAEILQYLTENPTVYLATCEDGKPRVRGMGLYRADDEGILIQTSTPKDLNRQLQKNPEVELCSFNPKNFSQIRVCGRVEEVKDLALKREVLEKRSFLQHLVDKEGLEAITVWRLRNGKAFVWTMEKNFAPKDYVQL
jgi:pyridoxamine 5'-phosphate oxidase